MSPLLFDLSDNIDLSARVRQDVGGEHGLYTFHEFPDGESGITIESECNDRNVIVLVDLSRPNPKVLPLLLFLRMIRERLAQSITLITPYLPYMRQDQAFHPGESQLARHFAELISDHCDALITVEPHLHRIHDLNEIYSIPTRNVRTKNAVVNWITSHIQHPIFIGPDSESAQWVQPVADALGAPLLVAEKVRKGDTDVDIMIEQLQQYTDRTPVVIDDIISTGFTMMGIGKKLQSEGFSEIICIVTHAIFAGDSYIQLLQSAFDKVVTVNTISHTSNAINISDGISQAYRDLLQKQPAAG